MTPVASAPDATALAVVAAVANVNVLEGSAHSDFELIDCQSSLDVDIIAAVPHLTASDVMFVAPVEASTVAAFAPYPDCTVPSVVVVEALSVAALVEPYAEIDALPAANPSSSDICCVQFVADITLAEMTRKRCGETVVKIWLVRNSGLCTWPADTEVVYIGGSMHGVQPSFSVPAAQAGEDVEVMCTLMVPPAGAVDTVRSMWRLRTASAISSGNDGFFGQSLLCEIISTDGLDDSSLSLLTARNVASVADAGDDASPTSDTSPFEINSNCDGFTVVSRNSSAYGLEDLPNSNRNGAAAVLSPMAAQDAVVPPSYQMVFPSVAVSLDYIYHGSNQISSTPIVPASAVPRQSDCTSDPQFAVPQLIAPVYQFGVPVPPTMSPGTYPSLASPLPASYLFSGGHPSFNVQPQLSANVPPRAAAITMPFHNVPPARVPPAAPVAQATTQNWNPVMTPRTVPAAAPQPPMSENEAMLFEMGFTDVMLNRSLLGDGASVEQVMEIMLARSIAS